MTNRIAIPIAIALAAIAVAAAAAIVGGPDWVSDRIITHALVLN